MCPLGKNNCMEGNNNFIVIGVVLGIIVLFLILGFGVVLVCMMRFQNVAGQQNTSPGRYHRNTVYNRMRLILHAGSPEHQLFLGSKIPLTAHLLL